MRVAFDPDPPDRSAGPPAPPRVAFAVGRKVGSAVVRNRVRRRLRAAMVDAARDQRLRPGAYLVSAGPDIVPMSFEEVQRSVFTALQRLEPAAPDGSGAARSGT